MGLGSGEWYESRFLRKCIDGGHAGIGHRRRAVGNQGFLRRVNKQERRARNLRPRRGSRQRHHFRGGGSLLFQLRTNSSPGDRPFRRALILVRGFV